MSEKCPSSIWCRDSNPQPLERESLPIITRPGLPPYQNIVFEGVEGSGCVSVGRAVASMTRGPRFESSHRQNLY